MAPITPIRPKYEPGRSKPVTPVVDSETLDHLQKLASTDELRARLISKLGKEVERDAIVADPHQCRTVIEPELWGKCDMCGRGPVQVLDTEGTYHFEDGWYWYVWHTDDMLPPWSGPPDWAIMCGDCDNDEIKAAEEWYEDMASMGFDADDLKKKPKGTKHEQEWIKKAIEGTGHSPTPDYTGTQATYQSNIMPKVPATNGTKGSTSSYGGYSQYAAGCNKSHFTKITPNQLGLPDSYGYLRLSSERGGKYVDLDVDYGLFFSFGWRSVDDPDVKLITLGKRANDIPVFTEDDMTRWPPIAVVEWPDMKAPTKLVEKYIVWAFEQWRQGKNIQFGCFGAHGRTGTFLAALLILSGAAKNGLDAEELVHKLHCEDAIETQDQISWVDNYGVAIYGESARIKVTTTTGEKAEEAKDKEKGDV